MKYNQANYLQYFRVSIAAREHPLGSEMERDYRLSVDEIRLLSAMEMLLPTRADGFRKCAEPLRIVLRETNQMTEDAELAICNDGNEEPVVEQLFRSLRRLIVAGLVEGRGPLDLHEFAGPRYTECRISACGLDVLKRIRSSN